MTSSTKAAALRTALAEHGKAQEEYDRLERALALAETVLRMTRHAVEVATSAIKDEGAD